MSEQRGLFIVFEGIDGAGTTTQARLLDAWLRQQGLRVRSTREPSDGPVGVLLRQILRGRLVQSSDAAAAVPVAGSVVALLFAADRLDHLAAEIEPALVQGIHVISDRYVHSSLSYQSLDMPPDWVCEINRHARDADLTLFLEVRPEVALQRIRQNRHGAPERFETLDTLAQVHANYLRCLAARGAERVARIDGEQSPAAVFDAVLTALRPLLC